MDNFNSVAKTADECYKITKNISGMTTLNLILLSMESELVVKSLAEQNPHMSLPGLYEHVTPRLIKMMDRFLLAAMAVQQSEIHIESWAEGWRSLLKALLVKPLSDEGKACLRIIKLIETNPELYHSYFDALQVVPGDIIGEIVLTLTHMANSLPIVTHRQSLLPSKLTAIENHEPKYPDPVALEEEIVQFASQLRDPNGPPQAEKPLPPPIETPGQAQNDGILPRFLMRQLLELDKAH